MSKYYAYISGSADVSTTLIPTEAYDRNGRYLRLEYVGDITTNSTSNVYVWRQNSGGWFSFEQGTFGQYLNIGNTTYVPAVNNVPENRRTFNSSSFDNPAVFVLDDGQASLTFNEWTTTGTFAGALSNSYIKLFPSSYSSNLKMNFYELKIYGANNVLLYDFVPDKNGTTKGLRDNVSDDFFAASDQSKIELFSLSTFEINPSATTATSSSGSTTISINTDNDNAITWTASTTDAWLSLSTSTGTGDGSVTVTYTANKAYQGRVGTVTFTSNDGDVLTFTLTQEKKGAIVYDRPIYRSGSLVKKMYRSGELIYLRLNPPTE